MLFFATAVLFVAFIVLSRVPGKYLIHSSIAVSVTFLLEGLHPLLNLSDADNTYRWAHFWNVKRRRHLKDQRKYSGSSYILNCFDSWRKPLSNREEVLKPKIKVKCVCVCVRFVDKLLI